jgi:hypothetical protein
MQNKVQFHHRIFVWFLVTTKHKDPAPQLKLPPSLAVFTNQQMEKRPLPFRQLKELTITDFCASLAVAAISLFM